MLTAPPGRGMTAAGEGGGGGGAGEGGGGCGGGEGGGGGKTAARAAQRRTVADHAAMPSCGGGVRGAADTAHGHQRRHSLFVSHKLLLLARSAGCWRAQKQDAKVTHYRERHACPRQHVLDEDGLVRGQGWAPVLRPRCARHAATASSPAEERPAERLLRREESEGERTGLVCRAGGAEACTSSILPRLLVLYSTGRVVRSSGGFCRPASMVVTASTAHFSWWHLGSLLGRHFSYDRARTVFRACSSSAQSS